MNDETMKPKMIDSNKKIVFEVRSTDELQLSVWQHQTPVPTVFDGVFSHMFVHPLVHMFSTQTF